MKREIRVNDLYGATHPWREKSIAGIENKEVDVIEIIRDNDSYSYCGSRVANFTKKKIQSALPAKRMIKIPLLNIYILSWY
jgi:hypothetical protein